VDHVGVTVPDLDQAVRFFTRVVGCELLYRTGPLFDSTAGEWMTRHFGVHARARLRTAMLRCGPCTNLELLAWDDVESTSTGSESEVGAVHMAIYVDDLTAAAAYLAGERGVRILGTPTIVTGEPNEGTEFVYVRLPWGLCLELVRWPPLMPYCAATRARLYRPRADWRQPRSPDDT
jgi:catechol 2,3-dioxygenase-like lactoylglutathione lyase family enzyme